jgi:hypothetical protein
MKLEGNRLLARKLRQAVEDIVNDRRGLHWDSLDAATLRDLRKHVERELVEVLDAELKEENEGDG